MPGAPYSDDPSSLFLEIIRKSSTFNPVYKLMTKNCIVLFFLASEAAIVLAGGLLAGSLTWIIYKGAGFMLWKLLLLVPPLLWIAVMPALNSHYEARCYDSKFKKLHK